VVVSAGEARTFSETALPLSQKYKKIFSFNKPPPLAVVIDVRLAWRTNRASGGSWKS
jgi:hypothetical protein